MVGNSIGTGDPGPSPVAPPEWLLHVEMGVLFIRFHSANPPAPELDLPIAFRLSAYLFGAAEGRVYRGESAEYFNHWWHRDLLDERVVQDFLRDPEFYRRSRNDDARTKDQAK